MISPSELPLPYRQSFSFHQETLASLSRKYRYVPLLSVSPAFRREVLLDKYFIHENYIKSNLAMKKV